MEIIRDRKIGPTRIGELLVAANVVRPQVLVEALQVAKKSTTPLGRVLMSIGELTERDLEIAIEVQSLIRKNLINSDLGVKAINVAVRAKVPLDEAFRRLGWALPLQNEYVNTGSELAELLLESGVVPSKLVEQALYQSQENQLPLGRCLILLRAISNELLNSALTAQALIRDGVITREHAINGLKLAVTKRQTLEATLQQSGVYSPTQGSVRIGDLLTMAGLVTDGDKISAVETGLVAKQQIGRVFVQSGAISERVLDEALKLQALVVAGSLSANRASEVLKRVHSRNLSAQEVLNEMSADQAVIEDAGKVMALLEKAEVIAPADLERARALNQSTQKSTVAILFESNVLSEKLVRNARQAQSMIDENVINPDHAAKVLQHSARTGIDFTDALSEVQWTTTDRQAAVEKPDGSWLGKLWGKGKK